MSPRKLPKSRRPLRGRAWGSAMGLGLIIMVLSIHWGCDHKISPTAPTAPIKGYSVSVSVPLTKQLKSSLLGVLNNEVYYNVTGPNMSPVTGTTGPIATSSLGSGALDFSIAVQQGPARMMSFQINDASTHQPLALGAILTDINAGGVSNIAVTLGTVVSNCYTVDTSYLNGIAWYSFQTDTLVGSLPVSYDLDSFLLPPMGSPIWGMVPWLISTSFHPPFPPPPWPPRLPREFSRLICRRVMFIA